MTSAARDALLAVDVGRDAAAVVGDGDRAVGVERHGDLRRMARQRLVDGVVDDLIDHVMQARTVVGVADIHAGALAHRVETAQHLDRIGAIDQASSSAGAEAFEAAAGSAMDESLTFSCFHIDFGRAAKPAPRRFPIIDKTSAKAMFFHVFRPLLQALRAPCPHLDSATLGRPPRDGGETARRIENGTLSGSARGHHRKRMI